MSGDVFAHIAGDYFVQSSWMAQRKTKQAVPAAAHAITYTACFLPITRNLRALAVIGGTHYLIDRYRLLQYPMWAKNVLLAPRHDDLGWQYKLDASWPGTGYERHGNPQWLATMLMIVADNTTHVAINRWALRRWSRG